MAVELISLIKQKNNGLFPLVDSNDLLGGFYLVNTLTERNNIPELRRKEGMLCFVKDDINRTFWYQLREGITNSHWQAVAISLPGINLDNGFFVVENLNALELAEYQRDGTLLYVRSARALYMYTNSDGWKVMGNPDTIPVYNLSLIEDLENQGIVLPTDYITVPSPSDIGRNTPNTGNGIYYYQKTQNANYLDIIFSTLRALLSEVAKLKNSFKYGINSYTGEETAIADIASNDGEEPLWAIDPEDLSFVSQTEMSNNNNLEGNDIQVTELGLQITGSAFWKDINQMEGEELSELEDTKIVAYISTTNNNVSFTLSPYKDFEGNDVVIPVSSILDRNIPLDIMIILHRNIKQDEDDCNYIYFILSNPSTGNTITLGYWNGETILNNIYRTALPYTIKKIEFLDTLLSNLAFYSKLLDFSNHVTPLIPKEEDYKYRAAHITIRAVENKEILDRILATLQYNELIYNELDGCLYINTENGLKIISGGASPDTNTGMTQLEIIEWLKANGIIVTTGGGDLQLTSVSDITFIHEATNKRFKFEVNERGALDSTEVVNEEKTIAYTLSGLNLSNNIAKNTFIDRGFMSTYMLLKSPGSFDSTKDAKLNSDRLKIGAFYAPQYGQTVFGCSHAFVELESTYDVDIPLEGVYLYHYYEDEDGNLQTNKIALTGTIKKNSTYLIRGKQYAEKNLANVFVNIDTYDLEWYVNKELIDFTPVTDSSQYVGFVLTYGELADTSTKLFSRIDNGLDTYNPRVIDLILIGGQKFPNVNLNWVSVNDTLPKNSIIKNKFELDPARQAFQSLRYASSTDKTTDGSKPRFKATVKNGDVEVVNLNKDVIEFPKSSDSYKVSNYTPKASFENKNVCTDKTQLDTEKPNMVTVSFGIENTSRCFNWISAGEFDEYLFIKNLDSYIKFSSYTNSDTEDITIGNWTKPGYSSTVLDAIYGRRTLKLPGNGIIISSHKCIVHYSGEINSPTTFTYIVGRADKNGNPDFDHCSEDLTFTLYPSDYTPVIYQITDLLGFTWIEYQVWAAAAKKLNEVINADISSDTNNIVPVLINTGDMTQNGTRINEWLDYYNAGKCLFNHLEQMNVVGNNDLCDNDPNILGTGDDVGKSNSYYFHLFYCYELTGEDAEDLIANGKYIPSTYYFEPNNGYRIVMVNSEITYVNCRDWFKIYLEVLLGNEIIKRPYNIYTGYLMKADTSESDTVCTYYNGNAFTPIYNTLYKWLGVGGKKIITACHEMPFTVITTDELQTTAQNRSRSINKSGNLVGSHLNQMDAKDVKSLYWFSRLLESKGIKLCIGGHKHSFTVTYPIREYYFYNDGEEKNSFSNGPMTMPATLSADTLTGMYSGGKLPIMDKVNYDEKKVILPIAPTSPYFIAGTSKENDGYNRVIYFMMLATGYKLKSNKELPSPYLFFTKIYARPLGASEASHYQQYPMYGIIELKNNQIIGRIISMHNILNESSHKFTQQTYGKGELTLMNLKYKGEGLEESTDSATVTQYTEWVEEASNDFKTNIFEISY